MRIYADLKLRQTLPSQKVDIYMKKQQIDDDKMTRYRTQQWYRDRINVDNGYLILLVITSRFKCPIKMHTKVPGTTLHIYGGTGYRMHEPGTVPYNTVLDHVISPFQDPPGPC
jgi:hypothetical protein